MNNRGSNKLN